MRTKPKYTKTFGEARLFIAVSKIFNFLLDERVHPVLNGSPVIRRKVAKIVKKNSGALRLLPLKALAQNVQD